ncbi:MAG: hypothetical protein R3C68_13560 [Myxococcota bacterium]
MSELEDPTHIDIAGPLAIYAVSTEVVPLEESELFGTCAGAYVVCYVPAQGIREALDEAEWRLADDHYSLIDIAAVGRVELDSWVPEDEDQPTRGELGIALDGQQMLYGPFLIYEEENDDQENDDQENDDQETTPNSRRKPILRLFA